MIRYKLKKAAKEEQEAILALDKDYAQSKQKNRAVAIKLKRTVFASCILALCIIAVFGGLFAGGVFSLGNKGMSGENINNSMYDAIPEASGSIQNKVHQQPSNAAKINAVVIKTASPQEAIQSLEGYSEVENIGGLYYVTVTDQNMQTVKEFLQSLGEVDYSRIVSERAELPLGCVEITIIEQK